MFIAPSESQSSRRRSKAMTQVCMSHFKVVKICAYVELSIQVGTIRSPKVSIRFGVSTTNFRG